MWEVGEKVVRSESFSILFVLGPKHVGVANFIKMSQKLQLAGWTQENKTEDSKSIDIIKYRYFLNASVCCIHSRKLNMSLYHKL